MNLQLMISLTLTAIEPLPRNTDLNDTGLLRHVGARWTSSCIYLLSLLIAKLIIVFLRILIACLVFVTFNKVGC